MGKDVKVRFVATDMVSDTLRGMKGRISAWTRDITKIAAGIGLADSFKAVGRAIRDSVAAAAEAYPKLGAGLDRVGAKFTEFKIQAGAAFLEVLQPALPLLEQLFDWATRLATQLPNAFDGVKITLAEIVGWFRKLPAEAQLAFGEIARAGAAFLMGAGSALPFLGINTAGSGAALMAWSAEVIANAKKTIGAIEAETDRVIAKYGGTHDFGKRAPTAAEQSAVDKARQAAERDLINRAWFAKPSVVDDRIPLRTEGIGDEIQTNEEAGLTGSQSIADAYEEGLEPLLAFNEALREQGHLFDDLVSPAMSGTIDAISGITTALAESLPGHSAVAKAAQFAAKAIAKVEGGIAIAKGGVKIAESIFPPNPAGLASGAGMVTQGLKLLNLGGGGGGAAGSYTGGHGGSGGLSGRGLDGRGRELASRGKLVLNIKDGVMGTRSPEFRDMIVGLVREAGDLRELEVTYT